MLAFRAKTKKDLKLLIGQRVLSRIIETSMFGAEYHGTGSYTVVGPSPTERKWYAIIIVDDDVLKAVR